MASNPPKWEQKLLAKKSCPPQILMLKFAQNCCFVEKLRKNIGIPGRPLTVGKLLAYLFYFFLSVKSSGQEKTGLCGILFCEYYHIITYPH